MLITRSSSGWRITSSTIRLNSGSSSRNSTPLCARLISPGVGLVPPPTSATGEMVWCGERNGRTVSSVEPRFSLPATECILVVSRASRRVSGGNIDGRRLASMVLPEPGLPMSKMLCPPAQATSKARFTLSCPRTSRMSKGYWHDAFMNSSRVFTTVGVIEILPCRKSITCCRLSTAITSRSLTTAASEAFALGTIKPL